jgi:hypothetical protein
MSATLTVRSRDSFAVSVKASSTAVKARRPVTFTGKVTPPQTARADRIVDLQVKSGSRWKAVTTGRTTATGSYRLRTAPLGTGMQRYRLVKRATKTIPAASSRTVAIKVSKR